LDKWDSFWAQPLLWLQPGGDCNQQDGGQAGGGKRSRRLP
jgi:hypothetical protein